MEPQLVGQAASAVRGVKWDLPFRWLASLLAPAAVFGYAADARALEAVAGAAEHLEARGLGEAVRAVDGWLIRHATGEVLGGALVLAVIAGVFAGQSETRVADTRRGASLVLCLVLGVYVWDTVMPLAVAGVVAVVVNLARLTWVPSWGGSPDPSTWLMVLAADLVVAVIWVQLSVFVWLFTTGSTSRPEPRQPASSPEPTGAISRRIPVM